MSTQRVSSDHMVHIQVSLYPFPLDYNMVLTCGTFGRLCCSTSALDQVWRLCVRVWRLWHALTSFYGYMGHNVSKTA